MRINRASRIPPTGGSDGSYTTLPLAPGNYTIEGSVSGYMPVTTMSP